MGYHILIGVTGSVATIKLTQLMKEIRDIMPEAEFKIVATENSLHFFDKDEIKVEVITDKIEWEKWKERGDPVMHIELRRWADLFLVAPLDANTLAKLAHGLCDNTLTSTLRCWDFSPESEKILVLCPAMNTSMWEHPLTEKQLDKIKTFGKQVYVVPPIMKTLICGDMGYGAMAEPSDIAKRIAELLLHSQKTGN